MDYHLRHDVFLKRIPTLFLAAFMASAAGASFSEPGQGLAPVADFGLFDHQGQFHRLYYHEKDPRTKALVLFVHGNGCPLVRKRIPALNALQKDYRDRGVRFWMINSNFQDLRDDIAEEASEWNVELPVLIDDAQLVAGSLNLTRTAEALVIDPKSWRVVFRGPIDDKLTYEKERPEAGNAYLTDALDSFLEGKPIENNYVDAPGCLISRPDHDLDAKNGISYAKQIAPILEQKCVRCHVKGGIAPFAMSNYRKVRGWSDMIEEVLMVRRMPPWQADPHYGAFQNDFSLSTREKQLLVHWIRQGSPQDGGPDPLAIQREQPPEWTLGEPDFVIDIPEQQVPAEGIIDYRYITIDAPVDKDVWLRGVEVKPGNTKVLHHIIAEIIVDGEGDDKRKKALAGYAPGMGPDLFPKGTGILLRKNHKIEFQLHYTTWGKPETDRSKLALFFAKDEIKTPLRTGLVIDTKFKIPPRDREFESVKFNQIDKDIYLYGMNPHMHFRGKSMAYEAHYPDGVREVLLSVPHYNFNWQRNYKLAEQKFLPKGTKLYVRAVWDNSALNKANPDPDAEIGWGEQSFDEMFFATYQYVRADELPDEKLAFGDRIPPTP